MAVPDSLPSWHKAGQLSWEGVAAAFSPTPTFPRRQKQTQKGLASTSQPFLYQFQKP